MNAAYICDTPFQLFNCINLIYRHADGNEQRRDLYVGHQFVNSFDIANAIKKENLFCNVYGFAYKIKGIRHYFERVYELYNPKAAIRNSLLDEKKALDLIDYDRIYMAVPTHFAIMFTWIFPEAEVIYFEDGTGSYSGNMLERLLDKRHRRIYSFFGRNVENWRPQMLFVNNPELCTTDITSEIKKLPDLNSRDKEFWNLICRIFNYKKTSDYMIHHNIILLQVAAYHQEAFSQIDSRILLTANRELSSCLLRLHPRQNQSVYAGFHIDESGNMWELICAYEITDHHLLISRFSTAQMIPKLLFNKEPYLIFLYELYKSELTVEDYLRIKGLGDKLKTIYKHKNKIFTPQSYYEFLEVLRKLEYLRKSNE